MRVRLPARDDTPVLEVDVTPAWIARRRELEAELYRTVGELWKTIGDSPRFKAAHAAFEHCQLALVAYDRTAVT